MQNFYPLNIQENTILEESRNNKPSASLHFLFCESLMGIVFHLSSLRATESLKVLCWFLSVFQQYTLLLGNTFQS